MTPRKKETNRLWNARPEVRERRNREARERSKTWTPEKRARIKQIQSAHYHKLQQLRAAGICDHSISCGKSLIGKQGSCLEHWCAGLRRADPRLKSDYSVQELMALWNTQGGRCAISGLWLVPGETTALDHIIPVTKGGESTIGNLRFIHTAINRLKWNLTDGELRQLVLQLAPGLQQWAENGY